MHITDRVKELRRVRASELKPNPRNWRTHPLAQQDALRGVLAEVGFADAVVARELADGTLELVDGHLRAETVADAVVPVLVVDLDDAEATKVLLTHDTLAGMATVDADNFAKLLAEVEFQSEAVETMLADLATKQEAATPEIDEPDEVDIPELYQVVVECANETEQESLFERLRGEGYKCRVMTL
jgi:hypothetical protein